MAEQPVRRPSPDRNEKGNKMSKKYMGKDASLTQTQRLVGRSIGFVLDREISPYLDETWLFNEGDIYRLAESGELKKALQKCLAEIDKMQDFENRCEQAAE